MNEFTLSRVPPRSARLIVIVVVLAVLAVPVGSRFFRSVPAGHVAVATMFGKIQDEPYDEGLHILFNPFLKFNGYDARQDTHMEVVQVPSQDQLTTTIEVSIQFRLERDSAPQMLRDTGLKADMLRVHLVPKVRSVLREQGKSVEDAEDFFLEETQQRIQENMRDELIRYCGEKGILIEAVLLRDIKLPPFITKAIESKKEREQFAEQQKAELDRYATEQEQTVVEAKAKRQAAEEDAQRMLVLADAQAYQIEKINTAIAASSAYIKLEALKALQEMSKDPAAKIYFLNGDSPMPVPLMHMGDELGK